MAALVGEVESFNVPCEKSVLVEAVVTPLPICSVTPAPLNRTPRELVKMSAKLTVLPLKAVVLALAMLLPATLSELELARRPDKAVEKLKPIIASYELDCGLWIADYGLQMANSSFFIPHSTFR